MVNVIAVTVFVCSSIFVAVLFTLNALIVRPGTSKKPITFDRPIDNSKLSVL